MQKIIIVGGGPVGLMSAIMLEKRLSELNVAAEITLIDKRLDEDYRPGDITHPTFDEVAMGIGDLPHKESHHIKEMSRALLVRLRADTKVKLAKQSFVNIKDNHTIEVQNLDGSLSTLDCDMVFDATGEKAYVTEKLRQLTQQIAPAGVDRGDPTQFPFGEKQAYGFGPHAWHMIAHVVISPSKVVEFLAKQQLTAQGDNTVFKKMENLRKLGWQHDYLPNIYCNSSIHSKAIFYCEVPETLAKADYALWLRTLVDITVGTDTLSYTLLSAKPIANTDKARIKQQLQLQKFGVNLYVMRESVIAKSEHWPMVCAIGDAQMSAYYASASGIVFAKMRFSEFLKALSNLDGQAVLDTEHYYEAVDKVIDEQMKVFREYVLDYELKPATRLASAARDTLKLFQVNSARTALEQTTHAKCHFIFDACEKLDALQEKIYGLGKTIDADTLNFPKMLTFYRDYKALKLELESTQHNLQSLDVPHKLQITLVYEDIMVHVEKLAKAMFQLKRYHEANDYYSFAAKIAQEHVLPVPYESIVRFQSNLANLANKLGEHQLALQHVKQGEAALKHCHSPSFHLKTIAIKMQFHRMMAMLNIISPGISPNTILKDKVTSLSSTVVKTPAELRQLQATLTELQKEVFAELAPKAAPMPSLTSG